MHPDPEYVQKEAAKEEEVLRVAAAALKQPQKEIIRQKMTELTARQQQVDDVSCLPTLTLADVPKVTAL